MGIQHELDHDESADYEFVRARPCFILWRRIIGGPPFIVRIYGDKDEARQASQRLVDSFITREDFVIPEDHL